MTIKNKLRAGITFLFVLALLCCGLSIYYLTRLSGDAKNILKDNYKTVQYMKNIGVSVNAGKGNLNKDQISVIEDNLTKQEHNITEHGEQRLTDSLRSKYEQLKLQENNPEKITLLRTEIRQVLYSIMQLNMSAIERKNAVATTTADKASLLVAFVGSFLFLVAFSFVVNFPGYIANPIKELTER